MKKHPTLILVWLSLLSLLLAGCNLPVDSPTEEADDGLLFTIAAQTVVAQYTADAAGAAPEQEDPPSQIPSDTPLPPTDVPTQPPEPTDTLTPPPTETSTLTSIPEAILEDDFSNTDIWYAAKENEFGFEYVDGGYRIYNNILNGAIWSVRDLSYVDIVVEVDATRQAGPEDGYFGVVCNFSEEGFNYYALVIGDDGAYGILRMLENELEFLATGVDENDVIQRGLGATNRVRGACLDGQLVLFANGEQLLEVYDDSLADGDIGLIVGNRLSGDGIKVLFDNFALLKP